MQSKVNLGEEEHFEEPRKVRRESKAIFNSYANDVTELPKEGSRLAQSAGPGGQEVRGQRSNKLPEFPSLDDTTFTIAVIEGPSKGLVYQLRKACITVGRTGGGADFEFDEPEASDVHCIVAARQKGVRLYDAASRTGIYVNGRRVLTVELRHMSAFRVGSSLLLVSILPNQKEDIG
jgi:hypothetical protein